MAANKADPNPQVAAVWMKDSKKIDPEALSKRALVVCGEIELPKFFRRRGKSTRTKRSA